MRRFAILDDPAEWERVRRRLPRASVLSAAAYVRSAARLEGDAVAEAAVLEWDDDVLMHAYVRRPVPGGAGLWDIVSPYDFGGIWSSTTDPARNRDLAAVFAGAFLAHALRAGIVSAFLRIHPSADPGLQEAAGYDLRHHQNNVVIRLDGELAGVRGRYSYARRKQVRQGRENGLTLAFSDDIEGFTALYHANMRRLNAHAFYLFPQAYFEDIRAFLILAEARTGDGTVCARHLYLPDGDTLFAFLCHAHEEARHLRPNDFLYDAMIGEAHGRGFSRFHFGGGADTLYKYKKSFSPNVIPFFHARCIFDNDEYCRLVNKRTSDENGFSPGNFFPAYRAPSITS